MGCMTHCAASEWWWVVGWALLRVHMRTSKWPHTSQHTLCRGYYLEVLSSPATCFNATGYGALLIVDPEDEFYPQVS
jgi:hypothetical protein